MKVYCDVVIKVVFESIFIVIGFKGLVLKDREDRCREFNKSYKRILKDYNVRFIGFVEINCGFIGIILLVKRDENGNEVSLGKF